MKKEIRSELDKKIRFFVKEKRPANGRLFTKNELLPVYRNKLQEYSKLVYGKVDEDFVNEMITEIENSITPDVHELTGGTDEILTSMICLELAELVYRNIDHFQTSEITDKGRFCLREATVYFIDNNEFGIKEFNESLKKYIYRNNVNSEFKGNSGYVILLVGFSLFFTTCLMSFF